MLRYRGNDRNVDLGVSSIPQRVETARPGGNNAGQSQEHEHSHRPNEGDSEERLHEGLELTRRDVLTEEFNIGNNLDKTENTYNTAWLESLRWPEN